MSDTSFDQSPAVQILSAVGGSSLNNQPKAEFLNTYYAEYSDYFAACCQVNDDTDYRIENGCMSMISLIDSIAKQDELREFYRRRSEELITVYCAERQIPRSNISYEGEMRLKKYASNETVGQVSLWFNKHFPIHRINIVGTCRGPPGYDGDEAKYQLVPSSLGEHGQEYNLAKEYAKTITGKITLDVAQLTASFKGTGKSIKDLRVAETTAAWVSWLRDQDPTVKGSRNYFNEDLIACILQEDAEALMAEKGKYIVKIFDDITAEGWNSRNSQTKSNKNANAIFMVNRIDRQAQLMSFPDLFTLDKVPRSMASHLCEMVKNTVDMRERFQHSLGKIFQIDKNFRADIQLFRYPIFDNAVVAYIAYPVCTREMMDKYNVIRAEATEKLKRRKQEAEEAERLAEEEKQAKKLAAEAEREKKQDAREKKRIEQAMNKKSLAEIKAKKKYDDYLSARMSGATHKEGMGEAGISKKNWEYWESKGWIPGGEI